MDDNYIDGAPEGAEGWREVWREDRRFRERPSRHEWLLGPLRRLFRRATEPDAERQKGFNITLLALLDDVRGDISAVRRDLRADVEAVQRDLSGALAAEGARLRELVLIAAKRNDALIAALDQKIESVAVRVRDAVNPLVPASSPDVLYRRLEDALRGSEVHVRGDVAPYVRLAAEHQPVLDVGCGRGEFVTACAGRGLSVRGVDTNERSVADLKARGLDVEIGAIPECFASMRDGSLGSILAMHVVEHLPVEALFALFREAARTLRPGGLLMIETPNAESMIVSATDFWRDPTHLAPRHAAALTVLAREHGFEVQEIRAVHELPEGTRIPILESDPRDLQRVIHAVNDRLFAPADLRLVLRRR
jgi:2-polyprenyl-3-methyl-5-hydroxy-6-metoxy-1,4-benzoquinol methylase